MLILALALTSCASGLAEAEVLELIRANAGEGTGDRARKGLPVTVGPRAYPAQRATLETRVRRARKGLPVTVGPRAYPAQRATLETRVRRASPS